MKNTQNTSEILGLSGARLMSVLNKYYGKVDNRIVFLWENVGFLLAYLHFIRILTQTEIVDITGYYKTHEGNDTAYESIARSTEFYSMCFYQMFTMKRWTLPDRFTYNLTHPQSWDDLSILSIDKVDMIEVIEIWAKIHDFIRDKFNPIIPELK